MRDQAEGGDRGFALLLSFPRRRESIFQQWHASRRRAAFARHSREGGNPFFSNGTLSAREMALLVIPAKAGIDSSAMARFPQACCLCSSFPRRRESIFQRWRASRQRDAPERWIPAFAGMTAEKRHDGGKRDDVRKGERQLL
ncbi:hypothetical protein GOY17_10800 [Lysobacter soli]|uniref:hypothetical protein n=1 Tax=Lysobacter soli TaxID=453783 RepID=UPI0012ED5D25|nr:hypothetical protein [Lysobacter soli]QGW65361.1 hypothetical protein GOY17_10800 [Lysobacter soli]